MRRMFQGRMISIDGHLKRMQANWNEYVINKDNDRGYKLWQKQFGLSVGNVISVADSDIRNAVYFECEPNTNYIISCTKPGYECLAATLDSDKVNLGASNWSNSVEINTEENAKYLAIVIAVGSAHSGNIFVGDCGIVITKVED